MALKFFFAFGLLLWLVKSGKIDFTLFVESVSTGYYWVFTLSLIIIQGIASTYRWKLLLQHKSVTNLPMPRLISLTWVGMFFSSILPGAVTGDLIKLVYAKELDPKLTKTYLILTSLLDRILGLIGLLFVMGIFCLTYLNDIINLGPQMRSVLQVNLFLFCGVLFFFVTLFLPNKIQSKLHSLFELIPIIGDKVVSLFDGYWSIGKNKGLVLKTVFVSMCLQTSNICAFYIINLPHLPEGIHVGHLFSIIPLGLITVAIPISPQGLGVGHFAFDKLFSFMNISNGASLFNTYFICMLVINLLGVIPYLLMNNKAKKLDQIQRT